MRIFEETHSVGAVAGGDRVPRCDGGAARVADWWGDLRAARDLSRGEKVGFEKVLGWLESWRLRSRVADGAQGAQQFWWSEVMVKQRETWQLDPWTHAFRGYLRWLETCEQRGARPASLVERVRGAVERAGARRGLAARDRFA